MCTCTKSLPPAIRVVGVKDRRATRTLGSIEMSLGKSRASGTAKTLTGLTSHSVARSQSSVHVMKGCACFSYCQLRYRALYQGSFAAQPARLLSAPISYCQLLSVAV